MSSQGERPHQRALPWLRGAVFVALFALTGWLLHRELAHLSWHDIRDALHALPAPNLGLALLATALNYGLLIAFDALALRSAGVKLSGRQVALASFISFAIGNNLGALIGGAAARYKIYSTWGIAPSSIARVVAHVGISFFSGLCLLGGLALILQPFPIPKEIGLPEGSVRLVGVILVAGIAGYVLLAGLRRKAIRIGSTQLTMPTLRMAAAQCTLGALDVGLSAVALQALLPPGSVQSFWQLLAVFSGALLLAVVTNIPGGVGVFELVVVTALGGHQSLVAALLAFRAIYFLLPLALAVVILVIKGARRLPGLTGSGPLGRWSARIAPLLLASFTFAAGVTLLWSATTPALEERMAWVEAHVPLGVVELSHMAEAVVGLVLLVLARGLYRRLDAAYWLSLVLLVVGGVASLLKGGDYEEAVVALIPALGLWACRREFYRRSALINEPLTLSWWIATVAALGSVMWLGWFCYRHVQYADDLWWQFGFGADAPRVLRAAAAVASVTLVLALRRLLSGSAQSASPAPLALQLREAKPILANSSKAEDNLAYLGDKQLLFSSGRNACLMYAVQGQTWVALSDPLGTESEVDGLVWDFLALADRHDGIAAFYKVDEHRLSSYVDAGLQLVKLGEEARVSLPEFKLNARKRLRANHRSASNGGCSFELVPPSGFMALAPDLQVISDAWLRHKRQREKSFSLGRFDVAYLSRFPCGVVRYKGHIVAFATVLVSGGKQEVALDLMRYRPAEAHGKESLAQEGAAGTVGAPHGAMDFLLAELVLWAKAEGYAWFNLGMAPLSGIPQGPLAPWWNRAAGLIYRYGGKFYGFEGLRLYKEKFGPVWRPKYLAFSRTKTLPGVLSDVARLINEPAPLRLAPIADDAASASVPVPAVSEVRPSFPEGVVHPAATQALAERDL